MAELLEEGPLGALRNVPYMGVIYVVHEAMKLGFRNGHPDWSNLGQGQPEVGPMRGAPRRVQSIELEPGDHAYGPVDGIAELRSAIAEHYNRLYRPGYASRYTAENVTVASGGRAVLTRAFAALGNVRLGYQVPDYTAYEDLIAYHQHRLQAVPLFTSEADGFLLPAARLEREIARHGLAAFVLSNPCNPTGAVVRDGELEGYVRCARELDCTLILDEFYSHFVYDGQRPAERPVSGARYVEDVERDPVLLVDGLTKSFRYPGWRLGWAVGPRRMVETLGRAASALDGGPSVPIQRAALEVLEPERADQETTALRNVFSRKRNAMLESLRRMGIRVVPEPEGTFYAWGELSGLPGDLRDPEAFFRRALERRVLTVPGVFFDVNPGSERTGPSPLARWMRFSFGPPEDNMRAGLARLEAMVGEARSS